VYIYIVSRTIYIFTSACVCDVRGNKREETERDDITVSSFSYRQTKHAHPLSVLPGTKIVVLRFLPVRGSCFTRQSIRSGRKWLFRQHQNDSTNVEMYQRRIDCSFSPVLFVGGSYYRFLFVFVLSPPSPGRRNRDLGNNTLLLLLSFRIHVRSIRQLAASYNIPHLRNVLTGVHVPDVGTFYGNSRDPQRGLR